MAVFRNTVSQVSGLLICITAACLSFYCLCFPEWRRNDPSGSIIEAVVRSQGLWMSCIKYSTGLFSCEHFDRFFIALDSAIITARVCLLIAAALAILGIVLNIASAAWTNFYTPDRKKRNIFLGSAVTFFIANVFVIIGTSTYFSKVLTSYFNYGAIAGNFGGNDFIGGERYTAGYCTYLAMVAGVGGLIGSLLIGASAWHSADSWLEETRSRQYIAPPVTRQMSLPQQETFKGIYPIPDETRLHGQRKIYRSRSPQRTKNPRSPSRSPTRMGYENRAYDGYI